VVWQDDITQLNELRIRLQDTREQLGEENVLLQAEVELKENRAKADEQNRLYDRIASEVEAQLIKADELLARIEIEPEHTKELLAKVCVLGSYIKGAVICCCWATTTVQQMQRKWNTASGSPWTI